MNKRLLPILVAVLMVFATIPMSAVMVYAEGEIEPVTINNECGDDGNAVIIQNAAGESVSGVPAGEDIVITFTGGQQLDPDDPNYDDNQGGGGSSGRPVYLIITANADGSELFYSAVGHNEQNIIKVPAGGVKIRLCYADEAYISDQVIETVDIGTIWTSLDPVNPIPFTAEVHDEDDADGVNFNKKMQITQESWSSSAAQDTITSDAPRAPKVNNTYNYSITLKAKDGWAFAAESAVSLPFGLIVGGTEVDPGEYDVSAAVSDDGKLATISFMSDPVAPVTVQPIEISGGATGASISAPVNKAYNGGVQKQSLTVTKDVSRFRLDETDNIYSLKEGTDYSLVYLKDGKEAQPKDVGYYQIKVVGKGNFTGEKTSFFGFDITKAVNPMTVKGKTATVKYSKLKKKAQTLAVTKVMTFTKDAKDKKTYTLSSAKKGSKSFKKYIKINKTTGKVTVKKGLKKGTCSVKVKVKAAGNSNYNASAEKTITFKIKVK